MDGDDRISASIQTEGLTQDNRKISPLLFGVSAFTLGQSLFSGQGFLTAPSLAWLTITLGLIFVGLILMKSTKRSLDKRILWITLSACVLWQIIQLLTSLPTPNVFPHVNELWQFRTMIFIGGLSAIASIIFYTKNWLRNVLFAVTTICIFLGGIWIIRKSPNPYIDVYLFEQTSSEALLRGQNPYEIKQPNIFGNMKYYGPELVDSNGNLTIGNPYPPLTIYISAIGYVIAGDIRYSHLVAILISVVLIGSFFKSRTALLAAYILAFSPIFPHVLSMAWNEPIVIMLGVIVAWLALKHPNWKTVAQGLFFASKQYLLFVYPLILLLIPSRSSKQAWIKNMAMPVGIAFLVTAPLAIMNFPAFLWNVGLAQWYQNFRTDALSFAAFYHNLTGNMPSLFLPFIVLAISLVIVWRYVLRSPAGYCAALTFCLVMFFAFGKQAFANYYFLIIGLLCCTVAVFTE